MKALGVGVTHSQGSELSVPSPHCPGLPRRAGDAEGRTTPPQGHRRAPSLGHRCGLSGARGEGSASPRAQSPHRGPDPRPPAQPGPPCRAGHLGRGLGLGSGGQARPRGGGVTTEGMGPGTGSPCGPLCPGCPVGPHPSGPRPCPAGSQNLLQVQVPGEVECASLRLMEVPRDVAVAGKRVTGVRPPVVLHSVSQASISVPKTLMRLKTGFSHAGLEWRKTGDR